VRAPQTLSMRMISCEPGGDAAAMITGYVPAAHLPAGGAT
jgi:hypothetical protein